ncbi:MAG: CBS domain-containing protein [Candidatus Hodarchaeales archaeon]|jgi:CBS domain-containing protein
MLLVKDLEIEDEFTIIHSEASIVEAARKLKNEEVSFIVVVSNNSPLGILSDRLIIEKVVAEGFDPKEKTVIDIMVSPEPVKKTNSVNQVLDELTQTGLPCVPVTNEVDELIGVVTLSDCMGAGTAWAINDEELG